MNEEQLNQEQIEELNNLASLPKEEQQAELQKFLKKLSPEQIEFLKKQQGNGCIFCSITEGKIPSNVIYEDNHVIAVLDINPASRGHTLVIPKKHYAVTALMPDKEAEHLFNIANKISKALFDNLKSEGTNIFVANGVIAGQNVAHAVVHVIPRYKDDGLNFFWAGKKANDKDMGDIKKLLAGKIKIEEEKKIHKIEKKKIDYPEEERIA
ncbi:HIT domain-containing protein [Candidatus Woesearchaeota archaeon]|nr:HIT domain-containing protein [Candidatus Woesearchaeota archaeon]